MPIHFQKSLQECLPKIKKPTTRIGLPPPPRNFSSSTARWILRGCKHPKTLSFACDDQKENEEKQQKEEEEGGGGGVGDDDRDCDDAATLSDIDRFLMENFKSLYNKKDDDDVEKSSSSSSEEEEEAGRVIKDPPQEKNINGSHRFFVAPAAGSSSSSLLMEEARTSRLTIPCTTRSTSEDMTAAAAFSSGSGFFGFDFAAAVNSGSTSTGTSNNESERTSSYSAEEVLSPEDFITVLTYSNTPYDDFKKSMQEMIEARLKHNGKIDWEFMEELLFCYLNLNDKKSYRFILRAFVDMIVFLRTQNQNQNNRLSKPTECSSMQ